MYITHRTLLRIKSNAQMINDNEEKIKSRINFILINITSYKSGQNFVNKSPDHGINYNSQLKNV